MNKQKAMMLFFAILAFTFQAGSKETTFSWEEFISRDPEVLKINRRAMSNFRTVEALASIYFEVNMNKSVPHSLADIVNAPFSPIRLEDLQNPYTGQAVTDVPESVFSSLLEAILVPPKSLVLEMGKPPSGFIAPRGDYSPDIYGNMTVGPGQRVAFYSDPRGDRSLVKVDNFEIWVRTGIPEGEVEGPFTKEEWEAGFPVKIPGFRGVTASTYRKWFQNVKTDEERKLVTMCRTLGFYVTPYLNEKGISFSRQNWKSLLRDLYEDGRINLMGLKNPYTGADIEDVDYFNHTPGNITLYDGSVSTLLDRNKPLKFFLDCIAYNRENKIVYPSYNRVKNLEWRLAQRDEPNLDYGEFLRRQRKSAGK